MFKFDDRSVAAAVLVESILSGGAYKATKYLGDKLTVKATRKLFKYNQRKIDKRNRITQIVLTIGRPNYEEREYIQRAKAEGKEFPLPGIHAKFK